MFTGTITISRLNETANMSRRYLVCVDGRMCAKLKPGESTTVHLDPGRYTLKCKLGFCSSRDLQIRVESGEHYDCVVGSMFSGEEVGDISAFNLPFVLWKIFRDGWLFVRRA